MTAPRAASVALTLALILALPGCGGGFSREVDVGVATDGGFGDIGGDVVPASACLSVDQLAVLQGWLDALEAVARAAPGAVDATHGLGLYQLPGVSPGPWFLLDLSGECPASADAEPFCAEGVCYTAACADGGWEVAAENDAAADGEPTPFGEWAARGARVGVQWSEAAGVAVTFAVDALIAPDGEDWRFTGSGTLNGALTLDARFPDAGEGIDLGLVADDGFVGAYGFPVAAVTDGVISPVEECQAPN